MSKSRPGDIVAAPAEFYAEGALEVIHAILSADEWDADTVNEVALVFESRGWPIPGQEKEDR